MWTALPSIGAPTGANNPPMLGVAQYERDVHLPLLAIALYRIVSKAKVAFPERLLARRTERPRHFGCAVALLADREQLEFGVAHSLAGMAEGRVIFLDTTSVRSAHPLTSSWHTKRSMASGQAGWMDDKRTSTTLELNLQPDARRYAMGTTASPTYSKVSRTLRSAHIFSAYKNDIEN